MMVREIGECGERLLPEPSTPTPGEEAQHFPQKVYESHILRGRDLALILGLIMMSALAGAAAVGWTWKYHLDAVCLRHVNQPSPLVSDVTINFESRQFNGSFMQENVFRQDAGPEVDAAWTALGVDYRPLSIPVTQALKTGLTRDHIQIREKYGGGFPANVEVLHQLHCLNLLRKALFYNYKYYEARGEGAFANRKDIVKKHVSHCLDILRQQLMCTADIAVLGQVWYHIPGEDEVHGFVDFNTVHTCRSNYEGIRAWAEERQLPLNTPVDLLADPLPGQHIYEGVP